MIGKIKGFFNIKEELNTLNEELNQNKELIKELAELFKKEISELKEIKEYQTDYLNKFKLELQEVRQMKQKFQEEIDQFTAMNKGLQKQMLDKFEKETVDYFKGYNEQLKLNKDNYEKIKQELEAASRNLYLINAEIAKFLEISKNLKKEDFELTQFSQKIFSEDKNKLELMKRIDELERIMARMKRGQR